MNWSLIRAFVHLLLLVMTVFYLLTGLGITQYRIVEPLTFGLLTKALAFWLHEVLLGPFIVLLGIHVAWGPVARIYSSLRKKI